MLILLTSLLLQKEQFLSSFSIYLFFEMIIFLNFFILGDRFLFFALSKYSSNPPLKSTVFNALAV